MLTVLTQAWKSWNSARAIAVLASIALAVGIGSTTAIYTVVNAVMLKPLPYAQGDRFVALYGSSFSEPKRRTSNTFVDLLEFQQRTQSFDSIGWFTQDNFNLTSPGQPQHLNGAALTPSLAHNLGVNPTIGHWFHDDTTAVISNTLWKRLGADSNIIGQTITLNGRSYTVTGVMPAWFRFPLPGPGVTGGQNDVWTSLDPHGRGRSQATPYFCYARLKPGVTLSQAEADVKRVAAEIAKRDPVYHPAYTARLDELRASVIMEIRPTLILLFAAAALLLLITCANVAGLLLARAVVRARETAIRVALGASKRQLAFQYFIEGLFLSLAGAAAGVLLSIALVRVVISIATAYIPRADEIAIEWKVLLFTIGTAVLASALSSLAPLWQAIRTLPGEVLNEGVRASAGARSRRISQSLVIAEIALAFTLVAVGAVLITHLGKLTRTSPGFDPDHLLIFQLTLPDSISSSSANRVPHQRRLAETLEAIPGISSVAFVNQLPLVGCCLSTKIYPEGRVLIPEAVLPISYLTLSPGYFQTMRIPLRSGRLLNEHDTSNDPLPVVINQTAAKNYWQNEDPLGAYGRFNSPDGTRFQVIGVVGDVRNDGLGKPSRNEIYLLSTIAPPNPMRFVVRSPLPIEKLVPELRRAVQSIDPAQPIYDVRTMNELVQNSVALERVASFMTMFFALAALLMATLGVFGVVSYSVRQRTVEIGTRMALGAVGRDILSLILGDGLKMTLSGVAIGVVTVIASLWLLVREFEIRDFGALPFIVSTVIVLGVAFVASLFPAWRATLLSPMVAIRNDQVSIWQSARQSMRKALKGISHAITRSVNASTLSAGTLLSEFTEAARRAASSAEALQIALTTLCNRIGSQSAILLENITGHEYRCVSVTPEHGFLNFDLPARGFLLSRLRFHTFPLPMTRGDFETWLRWAEEYKPQYLTEIKTLQATEARIAVPLRTKNEIIGVLLLGPPPGREEYSTAEKQVLRNCAEQFALMIENARLTDRVVEQEKLRRDLALAAEVQKRLLPEQPPEAGVAELAAVTLPARSVGGDYYDFLDIGDHRIGIALADIAGKGVAAALIMSVVQASLRILSAEGDISLPQLAEKMNSFLHRSTRSNSYATFFYAVIDENTRRLRYVNAGHNPPYLLRAGDGSATGSTEHSEIQELSTGGAVIGLFPQMSYQEATIDLRSGDVLVVFTDGVTEALNPNEEEFGEERLKDLLRQLVHLPVQEISARISEELKSWVKDADQHDDLTFIVMKVN